MEIVAPLAGYVKFNFSGANYALHLCFTYSINFYKYCGWRRGVGWLS